MKLFFEINKNTGFVDSWSMFPIGEHEYTFEIEKEVEETDDLYLYPRRYKYNKETRRIEQCQKQEQKEVVDINMAE